ncbi:hypothetical protein EYF80_065421 [Liparis tanakae]|uniref:Uncharacterized protein n=1 Tax=Liparis tanakae TaxID=230148 RepID=A0A4Z2E7B2_9TELE|nr:hypothetical protein EYF80_065421 [Liparis tanakae]
MCVSTDKGTVQKVIVLPRDDLQTEELVLEEVEVFKAKRKENATSEEKVKHVQLRRFPVMIHIVKPSEGDDEERRMGGRALGASLSVCVVLKYAASRTCYDITPQTERSCFTRPPGGCELNLLPGDPERVGCVRFYFTRIARHQSGFVKVCGSKNNGQKHFKIS